VEAGAHGRHGKAYRTVLKKKRIESKRQPMIEAVFPLLGRGKGVGFAASSNKMPDDHAYNNQKTHPYPSQGGENVQLVSNAAITT